MGRERDEGGLRRARISLLACAVLLAAVIAAGTLRSGQRPRRAEGLMEEDGGRAHSAEVFAWDRDALRQAELEQLAEIAADETASRALRDQAQRRRMELLEWMDREAVVAWVLSARGFDAPVVTINGDSVNVVVKSEGLTREEAAVILELAARETGVSGGNIRIIPIN